MSKVKTLLRNLGPGLLFASMAIGTSHLVLSTKAGAQYGWLMIIPIILANILKYPFFEFGIHEFIPNRLSHIARFVASFLRQLSKILESCRIKLFISRN